MQRRIEETDSDVVTTVVCAEEVMRGWLARVASAREPDEEELACRQFAESVHFLAQFILLPQDRQAIARFTSFRRSGIRIGTMDLKIACIVLEYDATLLTRNTVDFAKVPGLRFENWLD